MQRVVWVAFCLIAFLCADVTMDIDSYKVLHFPKVVRSVYVGDGTIVNVKNIGGSKEVLLYGKKLGNTSLFVLFRDRSYENIGVHVQRDLDTLSKIVQAIEPHIEIKSDSDGHLFIIGSYSSLSKQKVVQDLLHKYGYEENRVIDLAKMSNYQRLIRARLYAIEIDENRAKDLRTNLRLAHNKTIQAMLDILPTAPTFAGSLLSGNYQRVFGSNSIAMLIRFLQQKGVAKIIDDTMVTMKEEQNGTIFVGGEIYIPTQISYDATGRPTVGTQAKKYGLSLQVQPKIIGDRIDMKISLVSSDFDTDPTHRVTIGSDLRGNPITIPSFVTKESTTSILAYDNQVIAIGGKLSRFSAKLKQKVPLLGDLPIMGALFKNESEQRSYKDIIFFIIPTIAKVEKLDDTKKIQKYGINALQQTTNHSKNSTSLVHPIVAGKIEVAQEDEKPKKAQISKKKLFKVALHRCYIRSSKSDNIVDIWKKDHGFLGEDIGNGWIAIYKDCGYSHICNIMKHNVKIGKKCVKKY